MFKKTQTLEQMQAAGWDFSPPRPCSKCGEPVSWAASPTTGKNLSFDAYTPNFHWRHCAGNDQAGQAPAASPSPARASAPARPAPAPARTSPASNADLYQKIDELCVGVRALIAKLDTFLESPAPVRRRPDEGPY